MAPVVRPSFRFFPRTANQSQQSHRSKAYSWAVQAARALARALTRGAARTHAPAPAPAPVPALDFSVGLRSLSLCGLSGEVEGWVVESRQYCSRATGHLGLLKCPRWLLASWNRRAAALVAADVGGGGGSAAVAARCAAAASAAVAPPYEHGVAAPARRDDGWRVDLADAAGIAPVPRTETKTAASAHGSGVAHVAAAAVWAQSATAASVGWVVEKFEKYVAAAAAAAAAVVALLGPADRRRKGPQPGNRSLGLGTSAVQR